MAVDADRRRFGRRSPPADGRVLDLRTDDATAWSDEHLVSATAHQLRGSLTVMRGALETLRRRPDIDAATRDDLVDHAIAAARRQESLIGTLLDARGVASGNGGPRHVAEERFVAEDVDLRTSIARVTRESLTPEDRQRVRLRVPDRVSVRIDPVALDCVVSNLIANAIGYSPAASPVEVSADEIDGEVLVTVTDRGPGIALEDRERIFEPYQRSSRVAGKGLGLAIARWAVASSSGRIWVEGASGEGARFCFTLRPGSSSP